METKYDHYYPISAYSCMKIEKNNIIHNKFTSVINKLYDWIWSTKIYG